MLASFTAACGSVQSAERSDDPAAKLLASAEKAAESVVSDLAEALGTTDKTTEEASTSPTPAVKAPPVTARRARPVQVKPVVAEAAPSAVAAGPIAEPSPEPPAPVEEEIAAEPAVVRAADYTVYSAADMDVIPPTPPVVAGRPWRLKAGPSVEVIVASDGSVEKVQVLGGNTRMTDTQVLSHVKAWKFAPALRAGDPVRYRLLLEDPVMAP